MLSFLKCISGGESSGVDQTAQCYSKQQQNNFLMPRHKTVAPIGKKIYVLCIILLYFIIYHVIKFISTSTEICLCFRGLFVVVVVVEIVDITAD